jgi:glycerol-3-phosphate O-acyltransferase / dihydroxyacetone phosphate acyltransferase
LITQHKNNNTNHINLFLRAFYRFLQGFAIITFGLYYRRIVFKNKERLREEGPLLIISNHPNTLVDPLISLMWARERCFLLANYSMFKHPVSNWLLSRLYCIPVKRPQDVDGQVVNNDKAFERCDIHLHDNGSIYIAVEGTSFPERHIREFKTGTARIAFSAESKRDFNLNLRILLVGITYFDGLKPNTDIMVNIGEVISVDEWKEKYAQNPRTVVQDFTNFLENNMKTLVIHCCKAEDDNVLRKLELLLESEKPLTTEGVYARSKKLIHKMEDWQDRDEASYLLFKDQVNYYFSILKNNNLRDVNTEKYNPLSKIPILLLGLPIFLYGFINNIIPTWLSNSLIKWMKQHPVYDTTIRYLAGLIFFPIFWWIQTAFFSYFIKNDTWSWLYFLSLIPAGLAARRLYTEGVKFLNYFKFKNANKNLRLSEMRHELLTSELLNDMF